MKIGVRKERPAVEDCMNEGIRGQDIGKIVETD